jgi:hypothetical protein
VGIEVLKGNTNSAKKPYVRPALTRREKLSAVTAVPPSSNMKTL